MTGQIILWTVLLFPLMLGFLFRVNTSHLFFSLMAGELLARYFAHDVDKLAEQNTVHYSWPLGELALIITPMLITSVLLRNTVSKNKLILHIIPLAITGVVFAAFVLPILPNNIQTEIATTTIGAYLLDLNRFIIGGVVVLQLISLWLFAKLGNKEKHSKHE